MANVKAHFQNINITVNKTSGSRLFFFIVATGMACLHQSSSLKEFYRLTENLDRKKTSDAAKR